MRLRLHSLFDPETGGGTGGGGTQNPPAGNDPAAAFSNLLARSSDAAALARQLFEENFRYRTELRDLQRQVPAQGAVVLTAEQAQAWTAYQQLGAPGDVQTAIQQGKTLKRDLELRDVASAANYSIDVLRTLAGELAFEVRDEQKDGKSVKAVYVKADGKDIPVETYATQQWAAFLPALQPTPPAGQVGAPHTGATNPPGTHGQTPPAKFDPKNPPRLSSIEWKK
jgi:hypothetical protein